MGKALNNEHWIILHQYVSFYYESPIQPRRTSAIYARKLLAVPEKSSPEMEDTPFQVPLFPALNPLRHPRLRLLRKFL